MSENIIVFLKLLSAITLGMILSIFFTKQILNINKKKNNVQIEREYLQNHINKKGTPTMGGIAFVFSTLITFLIINFNDVINYKIYAILLGFLGFFIMKALLPTDITLFKERINSSSSSSQHSKPFICVKDLFKSTFLTYPTSSPVVLSRDFPTYSLKIFRINSS